MVRTLWWKFMINVGINQASAILRASYGVFQRSEHARALMRAAMDEVIRLSRATGTGLTDADLAAWFETLATLDPGGKTSMLQDVEAGRPTEVDLFADTVVRLAGEHGLDAPVNRTFGQIIRAWEESVIEGMRPA
ncbi:MAG: ketopantoate reductase family protein [Spirochaetota bacterium]